MSAGERIDLLTSEHLAEAKSWRRHLHRHPELAFDERQTSEFVASQLQRFGYEVHRGLAETGVVGTLTRGSHRRAIGIRADMDALPIAEQSGASHASSVRGVMHACGHDGHVAMALTAARACAMLPNIDGTVRFIFQPAEEGGGGARRMISDGLFEKFPCDTVYAIHNQPALPLGNCVVRDGVMLAASGVFEIEVTGRGCHAGRPQQGVDPIVAACQLVSSLQTIVSRGTDPLQSAVISVTQIHSGEAWNAVPDAAVIRGTTRWFSDSVGDLIEHRMIEMARSIAVAFGCHAKVCYEHKYSATINDPKAAGLVRSIATALSGVCVVDHPPTTGSEDFSEMLAVVPGCYVWLGSGRSNSDPGLHSPRYDFNDDLLPIGARLWTALVHESLTRAE